MRRADGKLGFCEVARPAKRTRIAAEFWSLNLAITDVVVRFIGKLITYPIILFDRKLQVARPFASGIS